MSERTGKTSRDRLAEAIARNTGLIKGTDDESALHGIDFTKSFIGTTGYMLPGTATVMLNALDGISPVLAYQLPMAIADLTGQWFIWRAEKARLVGKEELSSLYREWQLGSQAVAAYGGAAAGIVELSIGARESPESAFLSALTAVWIGALAVREFRAERLTSTTYSDVSKTRNMHVMTTAIQTGLFEAGVTGAAAIIGSQVAEVGAAGAIVAGAMVGSHYLRKTRDEHQYRAKNVLAHEHEANQRDPLWRLEQGEPMIIDAT